MATSKAAILAERVAQWREYNPGTLAEYAGDVYAWHDASIAYLERVRDALVDAVQELPGSMPEDAWQDYFTDIAHEVADGAVPIMTHRVWATFADLGAWNVDDEGLAEGEDGMTRRAMIILYVVANRVANALLAELVADLDGAE
jgi:hypothetical protein